MRVTNLIMNIRFAEERSSLNGWVSCSFGKWIATHKVLVALWGTIGYEPMIELTHTHQPPTEVGRFSQLDNKPTIGNVSIC
jgi:hypothetical protein